MLSDSNSFSIAHTTNPEDFDVCAAIMSQTVPWFAMGMDHEACLKAFESAFREVHVLKKEKEIIGFAIIQPQGSFKGYIQTLAVNEKYRGAGYGTQLLQFCEARILQYSPNIFICVSAFNHGALKLYTKFGFKLIGEIPDFIKEGFTELLLRKTVGQVLGYKGPVIQQQY